MFDARQIIRNNMPEIKAGIIEEVERDAKFAERFKKALGISEDVIVLNGSDIKLEVVKKQ